MTESAKKEPKFEAEIRWASPYWRVRVYTLPRKETKYGSLHMEHSVANNDYCFTKIGAIFSAKRLIHKAHKEARGREGLTIRG